MEYCAETCSTDYLSKGKRDALTEQELQALENICSLAKKLKRTPEAGELPPGSLEALAKLNPDTRKAYMSLGMFTKRHDSWKRQNV